MISPDGSAWTVRRRRRSADDERDEDGDGEDGPGGLAPLAALGYTIAVGVGYGVSRDAGLALALVESAALLLVALAWARRPWYVEASSDGLQPHLAWLVRGRRRSREVAVEVAKALERGHVDVDPLGAERL